jgi:hypothetical protein
LIDSSFWLNACQASWLWFAHRSLDIVRRAGISERIITIPIRNITAPAHWPKPGTTHNDVTSAYNWIKTSWPLAKA